MVLLLYCPVVLARQTMGLLRSSRREGVRQEGVIWVALAVITPLTLWVRGARTWANILGPFGLVVTLCVLIWILVAFL